MRTVYEVVGQYQPPNAEPDHWATFDTLEKAQNYLRGLGYLE